MGIKPGFLEILDSIHLNPKTITHYTAGAEHTTAGLNNPHNGLKNNLIHPVHRCI
jgi:hypothetical protein